MEKKNVVLLTVIAVATLLITVVGATFAYFTATVSGTEKAEEIKITAANDLTITYNDGETITGENILPGWGETYDKNNSYEMTVVNNSKTADITYTMKWNSVFNGLNANDKKNLTMTANAAVTWNTGDGHLEEDSTQAVQPTINGQKFPDASFTGDFVTQTLKPGEKATYTIAVKYAYDAENIQDSKGASFSGKIVIDEGSIRAVQHVAADA